MEGASGAVEHAPFREGACKAALRAFSSRVFILVEACGGERPGDLVRKRPDNRRVAWWRSSPATIRH